MRPLPRSFYHRSTLLVAKELLGKRIIRTNGTQILSGIIVETEAYLYNDPASHSFNGPTQRNNVMFGPGGHLYVYFTYGMHYCANVVTGPKGLGEAVLIRAVEPVQGLEWMAKHRFQDRTDSPLDLKRRIALTNGPAKFAQAFSLTTEQNGLDLLNSDVIITNGSTLSRGQITVSTRIGISKAAEKRWRFCVKGNAWVSRT